MINISCQINKLENGSALSSFEFANGDIASGVSKFHESLPNYKRTPLVSLSVLAGKLGIDKLLVKDESYRFGLNSFKVLGASYAIAKVLGNMLNLADRELTYENIFAGRSKFQEITFVTATDGNHGRAVAWAAEKFGCNAIVYLPEGSSSVRLEAIKQFGAKASITEKNYDDTVLHAKKIAKENGWILLQDTSWDGYEKIPVQIMQGYFTLINEFIGQGKNIWPTHVFVQAGVGSLAAAILAYLHSFTNKSTPVFVVVEPQGASCLFESIRIGDNKPHRILGDLPTIMAGLACGKPSHLGLKVLSAGASAFIKCSDDVARLGMQMLGKPLGDDQVIISGESGAVTLGLVYELLLNKKYSNLKEKLHITNSSKILLFSTEGDTDPDAYRKIVWS